MPPTVQLYILLEVTLQQALQGDAVTGLVTGHLVDGVARRRACENVPTGHFQHRNGPSGRFTGRLVRDSHARTCHFGTSGRWKTGFSIHYYIHS